MSAAPSSTAGPAAPARVATVAGIDHGLALMGIPLTRFLAEARVSRSTWSRWRNGGAKPSERWAEVVQVFFALEGAHDASARSTDAPQSPASDPVPLTGSSPPTGRPPTFRPVATSPDAQPTAAAPAGAFLPHPLGLAPISPEATVADLAERTAILIRRERSLSDRLDRMPPTDELLGERLRLDRVWSRMVRRIGRRVSRLSRTRSPTIRAVGLKADVYIELATTGWAADPDRDRLGLSIARDAFLALEAACLPDAGTGASVGSGSEVVVDADPDALLIDFAGRVARLIVREDRLVLRTVQIEDEVMQIMRDHPRPQRAECELRMTSETTVDPDGMRVMTIREPAGWAAEFNANDHAHKEALAARERWREAEEERRGLPWWNKLRARAIARLERWGVRLAEMEPLTQAGLAAKAAGVVAAAEGDELPDDWRQKLAVSLGRDVVRLAATRSSAAPAAWAAPAPDPFVGYHREIMGLQAKIEELDGTPEEDALWARWKAIDAAALASSPTTLAGAVGALDYARRELHQFRVEGREDPNPTDVLVLHLLDGALGVLRNAEPPVAATDTAALTAEWLDTAAWETRMRKAVNDLHPGAPDYDALWREAQRRAARHVSVLRRLSSERQLSLESLALKAAAVVAARGETGLDYFIAEDHAGEVSEIDVAVALSLARDVFDLIGAPARRLAEAALNPVEMPILGEPGTAPQVAA